MFITCNTCIEESDNLPIDDVVVSVLVEYIVEAKRLMFEVLGQINLLLRFMYNHCVFVRHRHNIGILTRQLCALATKASISIKNLELDYTSKVTNIMGM